ncbi:hypothetical protein AAG570_009718 [Ranatra chinensis]|uniref:Uncharacterized protein n=1 Tax=Ranatra chinensis TaxID=642074 RepID=A0ABD0ZB05_9HEMI
MASKRRNMFHKNKTQETTEEEIEFVEGNHGVQYSGGEVAAGMAEHQPRLGVHHPHHQPQPQQQIHHQQSRSPVPSHSQPSPQLPKFKGIVRVDLPQLAEQTLRFGIGEAGPRRDNTTELYCDYPQSLKLKTASKRRNMVYENKMLETTEIGTGNLPSFCSYDLSIG